MQSEVVQDFSHDDAIADHRDNPELCAAVRALEHGDGGDSLQRLGPCRAVRVCAELNRAVRDCEVGVGTAVDLARG